MDSVIGIDLSGLSRGTKGRTALAQLSLSDPPSLLDLHLLERGRQTDAELIAWVAERAPRVVAIDAPLSLPHGLSCSEPSCVRCEPPSTNYLARDIEGVTARLVVADRRPLVRRPELDERFWRDLAEAGVHGDAHPLECARRHLAQLDRSFRLQ